MGDRQGLRDLTLSGNGLNLNVQTEGQVAFSLSHIDDRQFNYDVFYGGKHPYDLTPSRQIFAHFDYWQRGMATAHVVATHACRSIRHLQAST